MTPEAICEAAVKAGAYCQRRRVAQRYAIALNGAFFNAQRILAEYVIKAYGPEPQVDT